MEAQTPLEALNLAKEALPMPRLFQNYGMGEFTDHQAAKRLHCPWCNTLGKLGIKRLENNIWVFKCWHEPCPANTRAEGKDEAGFIALKEGITRKAAFTRYLEMAGVTLPKRSEKPKRRAKAAADATRAAAAKTSEPAPDKPPDLSSVPAGAGGPPEPPDLNKDGTPEPTPARRTVWEAFFSKLTLSGEDRARLKRNRGFSDATIDALGFKSNSRRNTVALNSLTTEFSMRELLHSGLFKRSFNGQPEIETQFTGWGLKSKTKDAKGREKEHWDWMDRPLIPYLDEHERPFFIRPHKGNIAKEDKDDDETCGGHVYCPFLLSTRVADNSGLCVLTESEFKAAALWQCGIPAIGIPGTSFVKNEIFRKELVGILEKFNITNLVIVFDNEVKHIPGLPGYKPDPWDRFDTVVWARYLAWDLMKKTPRPPMLDFVRIGQLPDAWRVDAGGKETGKIDWDTALADFVRKADGDHRRGTLAARIAFEKVIDDASTPNEFVDLFPDESKRIITVKLNHRFHVPLLKSGGKKEEKLARRMDKLQKSSRFDLPEFARQLSRALRSVVGCYFARKRLSERKSARLYGYRNKIQEELEEFDGSDDPERFDKIDKLKLELRLIKELVDEGNGMPEAISNFILRCEYCLHTTEGKTERLIRFENNQGENTRLIRVPGAAFSKLGDWRVFCNERTQGVAVWRGGEKELQALTEDMKNYSAFRDIYEIPSYGLNRDSGIWFNGDCSYAPAADGSTVTLLADDNNVFWHNGVGYQIDASKDERGQHFDQGAPLLLAASYPRLKEAESMSDLFDNFSNDLMASVGDYDALLAIGMVLGYAAAPELYRDRGCHPGLWLYGKRASGKTTIARWLMRIWGFKAELPGIRIDKGTTHVGMQRDLNQYSFLPFWFDEYRRDVDEQKESVLRGAFDRSSTSKGQMDGGMSNRTRQARTLTTPLITGETSSNDGATRSRYVHVLVATSRRNQTGEKERFERLQEMSRHLHCLGRFLMENRAAYVKMTLTKLDSLLSLPEVRERIKDERTRVIHGFGYAAYTALREMLGLAYLGEPFIRFLIDHSEQALHDVQEETMINKFWSALISGIQREAVSKTFFKIVPAQFTDEGQMITNKPAFELNGRPTVRVVYIGAQPVFDQYAQDIRRQGIDAPQSKTDIQREISKERYYVANPDNSSNRVHRASMGDFRGACWVLKLDLCPFGPELEDALHVNGADDHPMRGAY